MSLRSPDVARVFEKYNHAHDDHGRFATSDGHGNPASGHGQLPSASPSHANYVHGYGDIGSSTKGSGGHVTDAQLAARNAYIDELTSPGHEWAMGGPHDTSVMYTDANGLYTPERAAMHDRIVDAVIAHAIERGVPADRQAVILGGLPGAGKSSTLSGRQLEDVGVETYATGGAKNFLTISADDFKELLVQRGEAPTMPHLTPMESAHLIHEESTHISSMVADRAAKLGLNIIWDYTLGTSTSGRKKMAHLSDNHYSDFRGVFVDVSPAKSLASAADRQRKGLDRFLHGVGNGGRIVPTHVIQDQAPSPGSTRRSKNREAFDALEQAGVFTRTMVFDNEGTGVGDYPAIVVHRGGTHRRG